MADVKNFGLVGVGSTVQWAKGGSRIKTTGGAFNLRNAADSGDVALTTAGITSSAGNVTLTTGNLIASAGNLNATLGNLNLSAAGATIVVGTDTTLSRAAAGVFRFNGTAAMVLPAGTTAQEPTGIAGMIRYNTDITLVEYFNGTSWTPVGDTAPLQTEIDNIETSLGAAIDSSGNFVPGGFTGAVIGTTASFTEAIQNVADYALSKDTLDEIFPQTGAGKVIYSNGTSWQQATPGTTSGVQAWDAKLDALSIFDTTGIMVQTGVDTFAGRTLVAPAAGITITNPAGIAGNPTFALANDLAALEGLTTTGYIIRTGDGTATTRSITGTAGNIVVTNGDGVASDTSIDLDTVTDSGTGSFLKVTVDTFGRVTGTEAVVASDITSLVGSTYVDVAGDTMTGSLTMSGGTHITLPDAPVNPTDAANKAYVDATAAGLTWKTAVLVASTDDLDTETGDTWTYANGVSGVGATLTSDANTATLDGIALANGNRVLILAQTAALQNGIYLVSGVGGAAVVLTRTTDADTPAELDSAAVFVQQGTVYGDTGWVQTNTIVAVGTTAVNWSQFSGGAVYVGGTGIDISANIISVNLGAGIAQLPSDEVGIDLYDAVNGALLLTLDGTTQSTATGAQLYLQLQSGATGGLTQTSTGLKITAAGVTNAMLANSGVGLNADTGTSTLDLGQTLQVTGTSGQGIITSVTGQTVNITASNATSSQKGVATFNTASFLVTAGDVTIKTAGVSNAQLVNSAITFAGDTGSDAVALGETVTFQGDSTFIVTDSTANVVSFTLGTVDVPHGGTGLTTVATGQILYGAGAAPLDSSAAFTFDDVDTLTVGTGTFQGNATDLVITSTATNGDLVLMPDGTGSVIVGPTGGGLIQSDVGEALTVRGNDGLTLETGTTDIIMLMPSGTGTKVTVSGPTASDYATGLTANDLVNKQYVDDAIATGAAAGSIKAVTATVPLDADGSTNVGAALPAGSTIVSVKVVVTVVDSTATLVVGKAGGNQYMTATENDPQTTGMYMAETYVVEAGSVTVQATVAGSATDAGASATVIVEYKVAG